MWRTYYVICYNMLYLYILYTLWIFITNLKKVQSGRDTFYQQLEAGNSPLIF